jgi:hypothetical protein
MSLFSWFSPARKGRHDAKASVLPSSSFSRLDSTKPVNGLPHPHPQQHRTERKHERTAHREQLYAVVREAMVRAGVLSSSYKFKVLSLDAHGRQFMVMVDLMHGAVSDSSSMAEIEAMVAQSARAKYDIMVSAVYWRASEHVSVGDPRAASVSQPAALMPEPPQRRVHSRPAPLESPSRPAPLASVSRPAPLGSTSRPAPQGSTSRPAPLESPSRPGQVDPLHADEVAAFQQALNAGMRGERALAAVNAGRAPQNYTLLTGFEDTEMASDEQAAQQLSATQYGALR